MAQLNELNGAATLEQPGFDQARLFDLSGRVAVVTGAGQGFGRTMALGLARQGADIAAFDINAGASEETSELVKQTGRRALSCATDVSDKELVDEAFARVERELGPVDILVNNAGLWSRVPAIDLTLEEWNRVLSVNLTGTLLCSQAVARSMMARGTGSIINIASISGVIGMKDRTAYAVSKHGILGMTKTCANEWAAHGVRVNAIGPGAHHTAMTAKWRADPEILEKQFLSKIPMGRLGYPEELIGTLVYLASDASSFVTGQVVFSDGGRLLG